MDGTLGEDFDDPDELVRRVHEELIALRGQTGKLTVQKFGQFDALRRVCGGGDLLDAFLMFEREMKRYVATAGRNEAAAAISITASAETVLDRLEHVVGALPQDGKLRDQRTARRWSDAGLATIARDLVYIAEVQGRLGREIMSIEITGDEQQGLVLTIDQMSKVALPSRAPLIRVWQYPEADDEPEERALDVDLDHIESTTVQNEEYVMARHHLQVALPTGYEQKRAEGKLLSVSIEGRDAPMRTVSIQERTRFADGFGVEVTVYRTIVMVDVAWTASELWSAQSS